MFPPVGPWRSLFGRSRRQKAIPSRDTTKLRRPLRASAIGTCDSAIGLATVIGLCDRQCVLGFYRAARCWAVTAGVFFRAATPLRTLRPSPPWSRGFRGGGLVVSG